MSILPEPTKVSFDADSLWVALSDGRTVGVPLAWYPRLLNGSEAGRQDFFLSPSGIHWDLLDEDVSVAGLLASRLGDAAEPRRAA
jgi:Protein of unknown function (DUF2442)